MADRRARSHDACGLKAFKDYNIKQKNLCMNNARKIKKKTKRAQLRGARLSQKVNNNNKQLGHQRLSNALVRRLRRNPALRNLSCLQSGRTQESTSCLNRLAVD